MRNSPTLSGSVRFGRVAILAAGMCFPAMAATADSAMEPALFQKIFDPEGAGVSAWTMDPRCEETAFWEFEGTGVFRGGLSGAGRRALSKKTRVDLGVHPRIMIHVLSCDGKWSLSLENPELPGGVVQVLESVRNGIFIVDVRRLTKLAGAQEFQLKIEAENPGGGGAAGLVFESLAWISDE